MTFIRPFTTLACGAVGMALVAFDLLRSNMPKPAPSYVDMRTSNVTVCSSDRWYEYDRIVLGGEVSPDLIAEVIKWAGEALLHVSDTNGQALDWGSFRSHIYEASSDGEVGPLAHVIVRVDVLP